MAELDIDSLKNEVNDSKYNFNAGVSNKNVDSAKDAIKDAKSKDKNIKNILSMSDKDITAALNTLSPIEAEQLKNKVGVVCTELDESIANNEKTLITVDNKINEGQSKVDELNKKRGTLYNEMKDKQDDCDRKANPIKDDLKLRQSDLALAEEKLRIYKETGVGDKAAIESTINGIKDIIKEDQKKIREINDKKESIGNEYRKAFNVIDKKTDSIENEINKLNQTKAELKDQIATAKDNKIKLSDRFEASKAYDKADDIIELASTQNIDGLMDYSDDELKAAYKRLSRMDPQDIAAMHAIDDALKQKKYNESLKNNLDNPNTADVNVTGVTPTPPTADTKIVYNKDGVAYTLGDDGWYVNSFGEKMKYDPNAKTWVAPSKSYMKNGELVVIASPKKRKSVIHHGNTAPFDTRLGRGDLFLNGATRIPFSSDEAAPMFSDLMDITTSKNKNHAQPTSKKLYKTLVHNPNLVGTMSMVNPYTVTRLYNGLGNLQFSGVNNKYLSVGINRMLDIRDQKRFYDIKSVKDGNDILTATNPTTSNIIKLCCNDFWGRTPYTYQDFVFCKYWNRIPNNRLITLRKYTSPTYDNLCWELMGGDKQNRQKFAPIATMCTFFGGDSGNSLKDIFQIKTGLPWEKIHSEIWPVSGDEGTFGTGINLENMIGTNGNGMMDEFGTGLKAIGSKWLSLSKFFGMGKSPYAFDTNAANKTQMIAALRDPNTNGPFSNRIQGPINRINEVYRRKEGLEFENNITLKFSYKARPIGGANTKAVMLDIMSNVLTMCSATAVFWGGGHRFMITPHAYPWSSVLSPGIMKDVFNGNFFGQNGAIHKSLSGLVSFGQKDGRWDFDTALKGLANLGVGVLGALGGAINTIVGSISGQVADIMSGAMDKFTTAMGINGGTSNSSFKKGQDFFGNIMSNMNNIWRSNVLKTSTLPYTEGMKALLIGTPVGNWHLTVGNPLNPIAVIGNLICKDVTFHFGEELGPDDFPDELECTVTLAHGMARDLAGIESMFNRGAGRIYQAPDYVRMFGGQPTSDQETTVDAFTGGTTSRVPAAWSSMSEYKGGGYANYQVSSGKQASNSGTANPNISGTSSNNQVNTLPAIDVIDYGRGSDITYSRQTTDSGTSGVKPLIKGNMITRKYQDN